MLETLRNGAKTWVAKILLGLLVVGFGLFGVNDAFNFQGLSTKNLASVGSRSINGQDFSLRLSQSLQNLSRQTGSTITLDTARGLGLDRQVLDEMIAQAALDEQADALKVTIGERQIAQEVANDPRFIDGAGKFSPDAFRNALQSSGLSEAGFFAGEKAGRTRQAVQSVASQNFVPRTVLEAQNLFRNETRDGKYFVFTLSETDVPQASDADLKKQYELTPSIYTAPEYRSVVVMKVEPADLMQQVKISDEALTAGYDKYKGNYFTPEKRSVLQLSFSSLEEARKAKTRLDAGEDIMKIAAELKLKETDITFADKLPGDFLDSKIAEAVFATQEGKVSEPVEGALATALIKVTKITPANQPSLADIKSELENRLKLEQASEEIQATYDSVEDARAAQTKFESIAAKANLPLLVIPAISASGFDKSGMEVALPHKDDLLKAINASDVGLENDALALDDGYVWFEVREIIPSALKPLEAVKAEVQKDWAASQLRDLGAKRAGEYVQKAQSGVSFDALAGEAKSVVKEVKAVKRDQSSADFDGPATAALFSAPDKGFAWALEGDGRGARVIQVTSSTVPALDLANAATKQTADQLKAGIDADLQATLANAARLAQKAEVNEDLWKQLSSSTVAQ
jgi:peptidyl-prolyl cis-trans isomerase D